MVSKITSIIILLLVLSLVAGTIVIYIGSLLSAPNQMAIGNPPIELGASNVQFIGATGRSLKGWFLAGEKSQGGVLLLHGVRSNREQMVGRADFLHQMGYSVLLFDFQAHGESPGDHITFGFLEAGDVEAAFNYLKQQIDHRPVGVIGVSLGGAAILLSKIASLVDAMVLESVYSTLQKAVQNRLEIRLGWAGKYLAPLFLWQIKPRLGFDPGQLAPINRISQLSTPLFILSGSEDVHTTLAETKELFTLANSPKVLWIVQGAVHQDLYYFAPVEYQQKVLSFLHQYLSTTPELKTQGLGS